MKALIFAFIALILGFIIWTAVSSLRASRAMEAADTPTGRQIEWESAVVGGDIHAMESRLDAGTPVDLRLLRFEEYHGTAIVHRLTGLMLAAERSDVGTMAFLLGRGADVNAREAYLQTTPLIFAVRSGSVEAVRTLIDKGADVNAVEDRAMVNTYPPLYFAVSQDRLDLVQLLVKHGADVNFRNYIQGWHPLAWAAGRPDIEAYLVAKGARIRN